ncbi:MAG: DUF368 domain-containing protein [Thiopseudomonas sp.]|nr:DUF368 domain-containing protein [Thiopseudomonas sp.]MCK9466317.1 DUF368 domain-containing protein [Thiopseudomonas sp.]
MRAKLLVYLKGMAMGAADVVPGVSGGTIAFITGIYGQLLDALANMPQAALLLLKGRVKQAWALAHVNFLLILFAGILTSIVSLARLITWLLEYHSIAVWSFFFGLVLVSCYFVGRDIKRWNWARYVFFVLGTAAAWYITVASPINWGHDPLSIFLAGAIAICAMILPGISGSFLLLLMGLYSYILDAVKNFDVSVMLAFALGCAFGLLAFAKVLKAALQHYRDVTLALLTGFMLGSLNKIWPWKQTVTWFTAPNSAPKPVLQENILPWNYAQISGQDTQLLLAIAMAVLAVLLVITIEWFAQRKVKSSDSVVLGQ